MSFKLATPDYSHLKAADFERIYEPSEDTFLFLDALEQQAEAIRQLSPSVCVEIGPGAGLLITGLAMLLDNPGTKYIAIDCNPAAVEATRETARRNGHVVDARLGDLWTALTPAEMGQVDILLFNPPYVVTPSEEVASSLLASAWAGGLDGREVVDRLLPHLPAIMSEKGLFYLLALKENLLLNTARDLTLAVKGFAAQTVASRRSGPEHLSILYFSRTLST